MPSHGAYFACMICGNGMSEHGRIFTAVSMFSSTIAGFRFSDSVLAIYHSTFHIVLGIVIHVIVAAVDDNVEQDFYGFLSSLLFWLSISVKGNDLENMFLFCVTLSYSVLA